MNPYIVLPLIKFTINLGGFGILKERIDELISTLLAINTAFNGDFKLKDKYWN